MVTLLFFELPRPKILGYGVSLETWVRVLHMLIAVSVK